MIVNFQQSAGDIDVPDTFKVYDAETNWPEENAVVHQRLEIVQATARPRYQFEGRTWVEEVEQIYHCAPGRLVSSSRFYMMCAEQLNRWPTVDELIVYLRDRVQNRAKTLPANIVHKCEVELQNFEEVRKLTLVEAVSRFKKSAPIADRVKLE